MWDHIAKPLNVSDMFHTIARWIKPGVRPTTGAADAATMTTATTGGSAMGTGVLPPLPGIDVKAGMATCAHKVALYIQMLTKFRDSQGGFADLFAAAELDTDPQAPMRAAHTLKGTAGNIGAKGVEAAAGELEQACQMKRPRATVDALLAKTLAELAAVMPGLQQVPGALDSAVGGPKASVALAKLEPARLPDAELMAYLDRLKGLLEDSDSQAEDVIGELMDKLGSSAMAQSLKPVAAAIDRFDFDKALVKLKDVATG
jgi:HPt (histidine-containing phosphotransfer) domain-containing protein